MPERGVVAGLTFLDETNKYLEAHPSLAAQLQKAQKVYRTFGDFLRLTQPRVVVREAGGSNAEVDLNAPLSRNNY